MKWAGLIALVLVLLACTAAQQDESSHPIAAADLGLAPGDLAADPVPGSYTVVEADPVFARPYRGSPPLIPHEIDFFLPITREDNFCLDCHLPDNSTESDISVMPTSHFTDLRNSPGEVGDRVTGARWNCLTCHVTQTDATPLVNNRFH